MSSPTKKLKLAEVKFYGRKAELQQLHFAWDKVASEEDARMVLIRGYAGSGKTRLFDTFQAQLVEQYPGQCIIRGKFDKDTATDPFSTLADAFSGLCDQLLAKESEEEVANIKKRILEAVGSEGRALTKAIPALVKIVGEQADLQEVSMSTAKNRLRYQFQAFVEAIGSTNRPIMLFLDDLQWADAASLDLVTALMIDCKLTHFLFIGSYRDNEVDSLHPLAEGLDVMQENGTGFLSIHIGNLDIGTTTNYIADALQLEPAEVAELAQAIHSRTAGNMYYTLVSLLLLEQKDILRYSYETYRWEWDLQRLATGMGMSQNVVDVTIQSLQTLPVELQRVLSIAAFLRSSFDLGTLHYVVEESNGGEAIGQTTNDLKQLLDIAVTAGLLENTAGKHRYQFVHDRVREAAYSLLPASERKKTTLDIGKCLIRLASNTTLSEEWMLFTGIDNINSLPMDMIEETFGLPVLIELNHTAGTKAATRSAYSDAASYLQKALEMISTIPSRWESHYDLCLQLYVFAANVDFSIGRFDRAHRSLDEVLSKARSRRDKLQAYISIAEGLGLRERHEEALEMDLKAVSIILNFPKRFLPIHLISDMRFIKSTFRKKTNHEILNSPVLEDKDKLLALKVLSSMWVRAYLCQNMVLTLLCITRALCTTLQYGLSPPGGLAFAAYGTLLCGPLADHKTGVRLGELSHKILELTRGKEFEARILFTAAVHIDAWVAPLSAVQVILHRGYQSGMETGDTEFAFFSLAYYNVHAYMMGLPLGPIIKESESLIYQIDQYGVESVRAIVLPFHQMLLDLAGRTEDPLAWICAMEGEDSRSRKAHDPSENVKVIWSYLARGQLAYFFGETATADRTWTKLKPLLAGMSSYSAPTLDIYLAGLIGTAMFRKTGKRKYRNQAQNAVKSMKSLMEKFNTGLNNLHRYYIMLADCVSTFENRKSKEEVRRVFDQAISAASKAGFLQDAALANELCGEFFVKGEELFWAKHYLTSAYNLYCEWGAGAKAAHLLRNRGVFLDKEQAIVSQRSSTLRKGPLSSERRLDRMSITLDDITLRGGSGGLDSLSTLTPSND
jgi:predicted ATPase